MSASNGASSFRRLVPVACVLGLLGGLAGVGTVLLADSAVAAAKPKKGRDDPFKCQHPDKDRDGHDALECGGDDCDDGDASRYPGAAEVCDNLGRDEDCNPNTIGDRDADGDGHVDVRCCNGDRCGNDCNDSRADIHIGATEICNDRDDNCNGAVDERPSGSKSLKLTVYRDQDGDRFGNPDESKLICAYELDTEWVLDDTDCNDNAKKKNPLLGCQNKGRKKRNRRGGNTQVRAR
ncbi:MAG: putative metal-binding motif-containing protein [Myxococcota bacterium]